MKILLFIFLSFSSYDALEGMVTGKPYQVLITEIMADPAPAVLLPEAEYIELFNRSDEAVDITGWKILFGDRAKVLGSAVMQAGTFLIVCDAADETVLSAYGATLAVSGMPAIVNGGQTLTLKNSSGSVIHTVTFKADWFESAYKKEGGYSLEMADTENPCGMKDNWRECNGYLGGTPGAENSIKGPNRDFIPPVLLRSVAASSSSVRLLFNESMDSTSLCNPYFYSANRNVLHPSYLTFDRPDYASVILHFADNFKEDLTYRIFVLDSLKDCAGNSIGKHALVEFAVPQEADSFDVVINEVLFDASPQTGEFIELHNRSMKTVDLSRFSLALEDPFARRTLRMSALKENPFLLFPDGYVAITSELDALPEESRDHWLKNSVEVSTLFALNDHEGTLVLYDTYMNCIDRFTYSEKMHADLLSTVKGVSLERIISGADTQDPGNWHSAAASVGYSTPGYANSQLLKEETGSYRDLHVEPEVFSPDNDGQDDYVTISLRLSRPGYRATITIYDVRGQRIRTLSANLALGTESCLIWDGRNDAGRVPAIGIYLLSVELYHPTEGIKRFRKALTLARKCQ